MRAASDEGIPAYIYGNHLPSSIARGIGGFIRSSLGDFGHNGRGFLIWTFAIFLPPRGKQRRMAPKAARGIRLKPGSQERRPLDDQPLVRGGSPGTAALETPAVVRMCLRAGSQPQGTLRLWSRRMAQNRLEKRRKW
ncbi:hypothetical protein NDU88_003261 [Pleurodeles waltl]|uniref:Uncharacterized protein n=1 Tax=Pleurodeles waltl TaxID=8319 RepID=A0AAV7T5P2_PLEWA|nr:hypothetical protein NDU88_003261 [Pleurodeles waltl]